MDDREILQLLQARDETALSAIRDAYEVPLCRLAARILHDDDAAKECVNDTYLVVWNSIPPAKPQHLFAYMATICRRKAFGVLDTRKAQKRSAVLVELTDEMAACLPDRAASEVYDEQTLGTLLNRFLADLHKEQRVFFVRRYWFADSIGDIAQRCHVSESKVKTSLHRTRQKLRDFLQSEGFEI